jgi:hypothetical protein
MRLLPLLRCPGAGVEIADEPAENASAGEAGDAAEGTIGDGANDFAVGARNNATCAEIGFMAIAGEASGLVSEESPSTPFRSI